MKINGLNNIQVIDEPLDAIDMIRQQSKHGHAGEEPLYICNISDIINKHQIWKENMPRVIPFYGKFHIPFVQIPNKSKKQKEKEDCYKKQRRHFQI